MPHFFFNSQQSPRRNKFTPQKNFKKKVYFVRAPNAMAVPWKVTFRVVFSQGRGSPRGQARLPGSAAPGRPRRGLCGRSPRGAGQAPGPEPVPTAGPAYLPPGTACAAPATCSSTATRGKGTGLAGAGRGERALSPQGKGGGGRGPPRAEGAPGAGPFFRLSTWRDPPPPRNPSSSVMIPDSCAGSLRPPRAPAARGVTSKIALLAPRAGGRPARHCPAPGLPPAERGSAGRLKDSLFSCFTSGLEGVCLVYFYFIFLQGFRARGAGRGAESAVDPLRARPPPRSRSGLCRWPQGLPRARAAAKPGPDSLRGAGPASGRPKHPLPAPSL